MSAGKRYRGAISRWPKGIAHLESTVSSLGQQGYLVQVQDITQEVESKAALREREIFFRSVFQAIPSPMHRLASRRRRPLRIALFQRGRQIDY